MTRKKKSSPLDITLFQSRAQQIEDSTSRIMRVNALSTNLALHTAVLVPAGGFKKKPKTKIAIRERHPDEARPQQADLFRRPVYVPGDGDIQQHTRAGSCHIHLKSFGTLT